MKAASNSDFGRRSPEQGQTPMATGRLAQSMAGKSKGTMPTLKQAVAEKKAQEQTLRKNPEIDAKLDRFIAENPKLLEYYQNLSKEDLIRKQMLGKMQRSEYANGRNQEIKAWVEENPEIRTRIEERVRNVPEANRERAFINAAKSEAMKQAVRGNSVSV
jgi:hypothetical protein